MDERRLCRGDDDSGSLRSDVDGRVTAAGRGATVGLTPLRRAGVTLATRVALDARGALTGRAADRAADADRVGATVGVATARA
jgi:hypothetical protein